MIIETSEIKVAAGSEGRFTEMLLRFREIFSSLPGSIETRLLVDQADPTSFTMLMQWDTKEAQHLLENDPRFLDWAKDLPGLLAGAPTIRYFDQI
jgi:quinol monooxygenase YgiN